MLKRVLSNEAEKAKALREAHPDEAMRLQSLVDGLRMALDLLPQTVDLMEQAQHLQESGSAY